MSLFCQSCERVFLERAARSMDAACPACGLQLRAATAAEVRRVVAHWLAENPKRITRRVKQNSVAL